MKQVIRTRTYLDDLDDIERYIARDNPKAGLDMWLHIDDQVERLADSRFPRRPGRVRGAFELVAHKNYIVILLEDATTVVALNVVHTKKRYP